MTQIRTLAQKRSEYALEKVLELYQNQKDVGKDFKNFVAGAPAMIQQNGFGQTLAFWLAKDEGKKEKKQFILFNFIVQWLSLNNGKDIKNNFAQKTDPDQFMQELSKMDQHQYLTAQKESMAVC